MGEEDDGESWDLSTEIQLARVHVKDKSGYIKAAGQYGQSQSKQTGQMQMNVC